MRRSPTLSAQPFALGSCAGFAHLPLGGERWAWSALRLLFLCSLFFVALPRSAFALPAWESSVTKDEPGTFTPVRPLHATYIFGWSGITAATASVQMARPSDNRYSLEGNGRTIGLARALWKYDVKYRATSDVQTLRPIECSQDEQVRSKHMITRVVFSNSGVSRTRTEGPGAGTTKSKQYNFPNLYDLQSAALYVRSQPLKEKSTYKVVVYPATNAYLATVTVLSREKINVRAGTYNAIKLDLKLSKVGKNDELEPHKKFKRANIWISDDADRLILRVEGQIFVGTIFAELQSIKFDAKP